MKNILRFAVWLILVLAVQSAVNRVSCQQKSTDLRPTNCETNAITLDTVHHLAGEETLIIVIARLGDGEENRDLNWTRLNTIRRYLTKTAWSRSPETIILAEGERAKGYGRLQFYVYGKLVETLLVKPQGELSVHCGDR